MENDEIDLSPLITHNATVPFLQPPAASPSLVAAQPTTLQIQQRPISKRRGKKRSSRACASCRTRKVRCNIVAHGAPCSNCRHDEINCVLPLSRRQRAARERAQQQSVRDSVYGSEVGDCCNASQEIGMDQCLHEDEVESAEPVSNLAPHGMDISEHPLAEILPTNSISQCQTPAMQCATISSRTISWIQIQSPLSTAPIPPPSGAFQQPDERLPTLPRLFSPFPGHLDTTDLSYLHRRDALTLPSEKLQIALLKVYVEFVHSTMPILDLEEFLTLVKYGVHASRKHLDFLLFQAVMFASVEYVSMTALRDEGYGSRETAKRIFFSRVRLLYDFDTTTDRQTIIQSLLLMSLYTTPLSPRKDHKDAHHYLGLAISLSFSLGLNRDLPAPHSQISLRRKRLERRIWWTVFVRDRVLAVEGSEKEGWSRGVRIRRTDCSVDMLTLSDFELGTEEEGVDGVEEMRGRYSALALIEKARICWWGNDGPVSHSLAAAPPAAQFQQQYIFPPQPPFRLSFKQSQHQDYRNGPQPLRDPTPVFETQEEAEYQLNDSASPSTHEDCLTPQDETFSLIDDRESKGKLVCDSPLGAGFGVDGEYDDYLEYLKGSIDDNMEVKEKVEGGCKAWQLDCESGRIVEV